MVSATAYICSNSNSKNDTSTCNSVKPANTAKDSTSSEVKNDKPVEIAAATVQSSIENKKQNNTQVKNDLKNSEPIVKNITPNNAVTGKDSLSKKKKKVKVIKKQYVITDTIHKKDTVFIKK